MMKHLKKHPRSVLTILIILCMGSILIGEIRYFSTLRNNLYNQALTNVMTVTRQQQQAFDNFIAGDLERMHSYADFFARSGYNTVEEVQWQLTMFEEVDAVWSVICLDEGWFCSNSAYTIRQIDEESMEEYRALTGSGFRGLYNARFSGTPKFGYYETFTFSNGHTGLLQKSYDRTKVSESFSLSFYNDQGFGYIVNEHGDILLRPIGKIGDHLSENIFDILTGADAREEDIETFMQALHTQETGSITFSGNMGLYVYTYVPVESEDWYLVSIVPADAITEETNQMLHNSRTSLLLLTLGLAVCAMLVLLIWRTNKDIASKDREIKYQAELFNVFVSYLSNTTDDVYMMLDQETEKLEYISPNAKRVLGVDAEDVIEALQAADLAADAETTEAYYAALNALTPGQSTAPRNTERFNPATGEYRYFLERAYCTSIQGRIKRVAYLSDRTKERDTQHALSEALKMVQAANDAKSAFLGNVSHDIRTPMNSIIGFLTLMREETDNPEIMKEYIQRIDAASQHLLGLINDVLDMNKIESGGVTLNITEMNLAEVIEELNTIIRPQANAKNQTFDILVPPLTHEHVLGDKLRINQILINLLSNAVKYTPEGGTIELRAEELPQVLSDYSRIRFTVSDNGLGMSEDYLKVIFDSFTREETEATRNIQGTGLGMAITKSLVDLMNGTIHVESELNKGSTFTVELELHIPEHEAEEDDHTFWADHHVGRMIVTDDEEDICHNIVKVMRREGVDTDYSTDGNTLLQMMLSARESGRPYDLILLDWKMPVMDGLDTVRLIRHNYPDKIPVLILSSYDWSEIEREAVEIGVDSFMPKPFFMSTFKNTIRHIAGSRKKQGQLKQQSSFLQGRHILVADDIEANRLILVKILTALGAVCDIACNGQEAVAKFELSEPDEYDLILMDVQMPIMDGYTATRTIRSSNHPSAGTVPIVAMTANAFVDDVRDALESGMNAHIAKPIQLSNLKATIQQVFDEHEEKMNK